MNEMRRPIREADEISAISAIVARHTMPEFVTGFRAEIGEFNDGPAVWITLLLREDLPPGHQDVDTWVKAVDQTIDSVRDDLLQHYSARYPLFRIAIA